MLIWLKKWLNLNRKRPGKMSCSKLHRYADVYQNMLQYFASRDQEKTYKVTFQEYKRDRSLEQNALLWKWHTEYAAQYGCTKEYAHNRFKYKYVLPILLRDDEDGQIKRVWDLVRGDKEAIAGLVKAIHSSDLSVSQMSEAMTEYQMDASAQGFVFTDPEDREAA